VFAAAVILPNDPALLAEKLQALNDSKQLSEQQRYQLRPIIEQIAVAWAVAQVTAHEIDEINILNASILAMHKAIAQLDVTPEHLLIDGNRFKPYNFIPYQTIVKGDGKYMSIAAASVLAKTYRDDYMLKLDEQYPGYDWRKNKGYPTAEHRRAIIKLGNTPEHRLTYNFTVSDL
jgi:ribonuclease HII